MLRSWAAWLVPFGFIRDHLITYVPDVRATDSRGQHLTGWTITGRFEKE
jgi:hypothetical protein